MSELPRPPKSYTRFVQRFPKAGEAWDLLSEAGRTGPLDKKTQRLVKLAIAIGSSAASRPRGCALATIATAPPDFRNCRL